MCYLSPGPRCAAHTRKEYETAHQKYESLANTGVSERILTLRGMKPNPDYKHVPEPTLGEISAFHTEWMNGMPSISPRELENKRIEMMLAAVNYSTTPEGIKKLREQTLEDLEAQRKTALARLIKNNVEGGEEGDTHESTVRDLTERIDALQGNPFNVITPELSALEKLERRRENQVTDYLVAKLDKREQITESGLIASINESNNLRFVVSKINNAEELSPAALEAILAHKDLDQQAADHLATRGDEALALSAVKNGKTSPRAEVLAAKTMGVNSAVEVITSNASDHMKHAMIRPAIVNAAHADDALQKKLAQPMHMKDIQTAAGVELNHFLMKGSNKRHLENFLGTGTHMPEPEFLKLATHKGSGNFARAISENPVITRPVRDAIMQRPNLDHLEIIGLTKNISTATEEIDNIAQHIQSGKTPNSDTAWAYIVKNKNTSPATVETAASAYLKKSATSLVAPAPQTLVAIAERSKNPSSVSAALVGLGNSNESPPQHYIYTKYNANPSLFNTEDLQNTVVRAYDYKNRGGNGNPVTIPGRLTSNLIKEKASESVMKNLLRTISGNPYLDGNPEAKLLELRIKDYLKTFTK